MTSYSMSREEFRAELEELILAARPDAPVADHDISYHTAALEKILFGIRDAADAPPDVFSEYLGRM